MADTTPDPLADIAQELAEALAMLLSVATDARTQLPKGELYTDMALNGARTALTRAGAVRRLKERLT